MSDYFIVVVQNPLYPQKKKKFGYNTQAEAIDGAASMQYALQNHGLKNRDLPLIYINTPATATQPEGELYSLIANGTWWKGNTMEDGRVIMDTEHQMNFKSKANSKYGQQLITELPKWVFQWSGFLRSM